MSDSTGEQPAATGDDSSRRHFLASTAMVTGLAAGYGTFFVMAGRYLYLYPAGAKTKAWLYVTELEGMPVGSSINYRAPTGIQIVVARQAENGTKDDFVALSRVCPHLGCQVEWQANNNRFYCPCHQGAFDPQGRATEGPPAAAGQSLAAYPLRVEGGLLFIEVPVVGLGSPEEV